MLRSMLAAGAVVSLVAGACSPATLLQANQERVEAAEAAFADLAAGRDAELLARMGPEVDRATAGAAFARMRALVPQGPIPAPTVTGWNTNVSTETGSHYNLAQEYRYPAKVLRTETVFTKQGDRWLIAGLDVQVDPPTAAAAPGEPDSQAPAKADQTA